VSRKSDDFLEASIGAYSDEGTEGCGLFWRRLLKKLPKTVRHNNGG